MARETGALVSEALSLTLPVSDCVLLIEIDSSLVSPVPPRLLATLAYLKDPGSGDCHTRIIYLHCGAVSY